jgi:hypothetical protein
MVAWTSREVERGWVDAPDRGGRWLRPSPLRQRDCNSVPITATPSRRAEYLHAGRASCAHRSRRHGVHERGMGLDGSAFDLALTGTRSDIYRTLPESLYSTAGITAILSPDGTRLAVVNGIMNLATGVTTRLTPDGGDYRNPEAWSPDGRYLATVTYTQQLLLASSSGGAESVDVADSVVAAGLSRAGSPPLLTFDRVVEGVAGAIVAVLLGGAIVILRRLRRSRRRRCVPLTASQSA